MSLYDYLEEKVDNSIAWDDYSYEDIDLPQLKGNVPMLCKIWDEINDWLPGNADKFRGIDAATVSRIFNETLSVITEFNAKGSHTPNETSAVCKLYARCFVFVKIYGGSNVLEQTQFVLNNALSAAVSSAELVSIQSGSILDAKPSKGKYKEI